MNGDQHPDKHFQLDKAITHYENLREDVRAEIKMRINQRDNFAIQLITMLGLLCSVGFAEKGYNKVIIVAPLLSIYYTMQILYSYRLHDMLAQYLREVLEPQLAALCQTNPSHEWESYYKAKAKPGIRRAFFLWAMWVVCVSAMTYLGFNTDAGFRNVFLTCTALYGAATVYITTTFIGEIRKKGDTGDERLSRQAKADVS